jgi:hypothetical protein
MRRRPLDDKTIIFTNLLEDNGPKTAANKDDWPTLDAIPAMNQAIQEAFDLL